MRYHENNQKIRKEQKLILHYTFIIHNFDKIISIIFLNS